MFYSNYTIGDVARVLGLSTEAVRYYENKKIIRPIRDEATGYRYYTTWDIHMLMRARNYRQFGLSLEQTADLLGEKELRVVAAALHGQEAVIQKQIVMNINLLRCVRQTQTILEQAPLSVGVFHIEERPGIYRINTQRCYTLADSKEEQELIRVWTDKTPFVYSSAVFSQANIRADDSSFDFGLGLDEEYAAFLEVKAGGLVEYYPPCLCVRTCLPSRSSTYLSHRKLDEAFAFLEKNGLQLAGDVVTRIVSMCRPEEEYFNWHWVWIPIFGDVAQLNSSASV